MDDAVAPRSTAGVIAAMPVRGAVPAQPLSVLAIAVMTLGAGAWTAAVGALAVWRHQQFLSHRFDLGNIVQAVWSTTQGRPLEMTDGTTGEEIVRLAAHVDPILVVFAPLWWLSPRPETLIVAYAAVLATGVYPVVRLALKHTGSRLAASLLGAWYLVIPWTVWIALNELNPTVLSLPLLLFAIWFLDEQRLLPFAAFACLAALTGELIALTVAGLGVWYAVKHRRPAGVVIAAAGVAWTALCLAVIVPAFNDGESSRYYDRFERVGGSPLGLLETLFTDPRAIVEQVTSTGDFQYLLLLLLPTAFVLVLHPLLLVAALPQLGVNLLSEFPSTVSPLYHYSAPIISVLVAATVLAVGRLPERARVAAAGAVLGAGVVSIFVAYPSPGTEKYLFPELDSERRVAAMSEAVELVPPSVPVTVTNRLAGHVSDRRTVDLFPARSDAEWALLDTRDRSHASRRWLGPTPFPVLLRRFEREPGWSLVFDEEGVRVYRRTR